MSSNFNDYAGIYLTKAGVQAVTDFHLDLVKGIPLDVALGIMAQLQGEITRTPLGTLWTCQLHSLMDVFKASTLSLNEMLAGFNFEFGEGVPAPEADTVQAQEIDMLQTSKGISLSERYRADVYPGWLDTIRARFPVQWLGGYYESHRGESVYAWGIDNVIYLLPHEAQVDWEDIDCWVPTTYGDYVTIAQANGIKID
jgi:hypothetical protein